MYSASNPRRAGTRVLFLDDSGKPSMRDTSRAVVVGGFSIPSADVLVLSRRIAGAKSRFYPDRGDPGKWEIKASRTITPNPWRRSKNRRFLAEVQRILGQFDCTVYTASIDKHKLKHPMTLDTTAPLQIQALVEHFSVECSKHSETGLIVSDWSNHSLDTHTSQCVASFVVSRDLPVHPCVYYASSQGSHAIQVADLLAGVRRRAIEGDTNLMPLDDALTTIRTLPQDISVATHARRPYTNKITLI